MAAFWLQKTSKKHLMKRDRNDKKLRLEKLVVFQHRFFRVWGPFWEGMGLQIEAKMELNETKKNVTHAPFSVLKSNLLSETYFKALQA